MVLPTEETYYYALSKALKKVQMLQKKKRWRDGDWMGLLFSSSSCMAVINHQQYDICLCHLYVFSGCESRTQAAVLRLKEWSNVLRLYVVLLHA